MAEKLDKRETVKIEDLLKAEMITNQALINILVRKGITTESEVLQEIKKIREGMGIVIR